MKKRLTYTVLWSIFILSATGFFWYRTHNVVAVDVEKIITPKKLQSAHIGLVVQDVNTGKQLLLQNAKKRFIPASLTKLFTTACALYLIGIDHQFTTQVFSDELLDANGVISGSLILKASGDPTLTANSLKVLAENVKKKGVKSIVGPILVEGFKFDDTTWIPHAAWDDLTWFYAPQIHALSVEGNAIQLEISPGDQVGKAAKIYVRSKVPYFTVVNLTTTVADGCQDITIQRGLTDNRLILSGCLPISHSPIRERVSLHNPVNYAKSLFIAHLNQLGITTETNTSKRRKSRRRRLLAEIRSPPLSEILKKMNKESDNLTAELLIQIASYQTQENVSPSAIEKGTPAFTWLAHALNLDPPELELTGGAGLSRENALTPLQVTKLLQAMHNSEFRLPFKQSLAIAGEDGTLQKRFKGTFAEKNLIGKTGTLKGITALAGYAKTKQGKDVCFCLMVNHHSQDTRTCESCIDEILVTILENY